MDSIEQGSQRNCRYVPLEGRGYRFTKIRPIYLTWPDKKRSGGREEFPGSRVRTNHDATFRYKFGSAVVRDITPHTLCGDQVEPGR